MPEKSDNANPASVEPTRLDASQDSHLDTLYRAAIGPMQADYYLPILTRFEAYGRAGPSWNWAACGITLNWMLFRGLWLPALIYLAALAAATLGLAAGMTLAEPPVAESVQWSLWAALLTMALLVPGFFGNGWLYRVYRQRLDKALASTASLRDACMLLARQSSSRPRVLGIALANLALAGLLVAGAWPSDLHQRMWPRSNDDVAGDLAPASGAADRSATGTASPSTAPTAAPVASSTAPPASSDPPFASATTDAAVPTGPATPGPSLTEHDIALLGETARAASQRQAAIAAHARAAHIRAAATPIAQATAAASAPAQATAAASAPAQATAAEPQPPGSVPRQRYLINVGLFAQQDNALRAHARLKLAGLPVISESLQTRNGQRTRVRAGPFATREQADAAAVQIRALQLEAVVLRQ